MMSLGSLKKACFFCHFTRNPFETIAEVGAWQLSHAIHFYGKMSFVVSLIKPLFTLRGLLPSMENPVLT